MKESGFCAIIVMVKWMLFINAKGYLYTDKIQFYVMDLTAMDEATDEQKSQGLVEWAKALRAESWEEVREIDNPAVKEGEALTTDSGGNFVRAEVIRNKRSALWGVATIEDAEAKTMELIMSNPTEREWIRMPGRSLPIRNQGMAQLQGMDNYFSQGGFEK